MNRIAVFILCLFLLPGILNHLSAHALFVDTAPEGKSGDVQEVTIFYAEPDGKREAIEDWWADVSEFSLWLNLPDGTQKELDVTANGDHFTARFTPDDSGLYLLTISHRVDELAGKTQYVFNASAQVVVGKKSQDSKLGESMDQLVLIDGIDRLKNNKQVSLNYFLDNQPAKNATLSIFSPSGWTLKVQTQSDGKATFVPEWKGTYLIEGFHKSEVTGKPYEEVVQIYTTQLEVG